MLERFRSTIMACSYQFARRRGQQCARRAQLPTQGRTSSGGRSAVGVESARGLPPAPLTDPDVRIFRIRLPIRNALRTMSLLAVAVRSVLLAAAENAPAAVRNGPRSYAGGTVLRARDASARAPRREPRRAWVR